MNPPKKKIKPTFSTPTLDPNFFTNNPTPVPLGTATSGSTTSGSIPTPDDQLTVVNQSTTVDGVKEDPVFTPTLFTKKIVSDVS